MGCLAVVLVPVLLIVAVGVWLGLRILAKPTISRNFIAEFNAQFDGVPESDKAWPLYKQAVLYKLENPWSVESQLDYDWPSYPGWSTWDRVKERLVELRPSLELTRQGTSKRVMGAPMSNIEDQDIVKARSKGWGKSFTLETPAENAPLWESSVAMLYGHLRRLMMDLGPDVFMALEEGDADRAVRDIEALLGLAVHGGEADTLLGLLIRLAMSDYASRVTMQALSLHADGFDAEQLARLQAAFETMGVTPAAEPGALTTLSAGLSLERDFMFDLMQRNFSDDGHGDGHVTLDGTVSAELLASTDIVGPEAFVLSASRKQLEDKHDELMSIIENALGQTGPAQRESMDQLRAAFAEMDASWMSRKRYAFLRSSFFAYRNTLRSAAASQTRRDSTIVAIALFRYRLAHGSFPAALEALTPEFIALVPNDPVDDKPLRYVLSSDGPTLYSLGADGDDDGGDNGGRTSREEYEVQPLPEAGTGDGDWVLFPRAIPEEPESLFGDDDEPVVPFDPPEEEPGG